jgi:hypothetical protein
MTAEGEVPPYHCTARMLGFVPGEFNRLSPDTSWYLCSIDPESTCMYVFPFVFCYNGHRSVVPNQSAQPIPISPRSAMYVAANWTGAVLPEDMTDTNPLATWAPASTTFTSHATERYLHLKAFTEQAWPSSSLLSTGTASVRIPDLHRPSRFRTVHLDPALLARLNHRTSFTGQSYVPANRLMRDGGASVSPPLDGISTSSDGMVFASHQPAYRRTMALDLSVEGVLLRQGYDTSEPHYVRQYALGWRVHPGTHPLRQRDDQFMFGAWSALELQDMTAEETRRQQQAGEHFTDDQWEAWRFDTNMRMQQFVTDILAIREWNLYGVIPRLRAAGAARLPS